jgi:hypothetical protein
MPAEQKPIDLWLGLGGIAVGIVLYLLSKTPNYRTNQRLNFLV